MPKPTKQYEHRDRYGHPIHVDQIVSFTMSYSNRVHIGRVAKITKKRIRINYTHEYRSMHTGQLVRYDTTYQAVPDNVLVLNNLEQNLTLLALKGLIK